jgi:hypothetical protein
LEGYNPAAGATLISARVRKILREVEGLNDDERQELRRLLDERAHQSPELTDQQRLRKELIDRWLLEGQPPVGKDLEQFRQWRPIAVEGKALSETIVEERR